MEQINPDIEASWREKLSDEFNKDYFKDLKQFLVEEKKNYHIYPPGSRIFAAFNYTPFADVKVVIIGQDPYHGHGQANGLCFSVNQGIPLPPSLVNIFHEIHTDMNIPVPKNGSLENWAKQGVLLLNATLTVRANSPGSHQHKGWETFTDNVIRILSEKSSHLVFLLWGRYAKQKEELIDKGKHRILKSGHPSPMSANKGYWFGNKHFSKTNEILSGWGIAEIDWAIV